MDNPPGDHAHDTHMQNNYKPSVLGFLVAFTLHSRHSEFYG